MEQASVDTFRRDNRLETKSQNVPYGESVQDGFMTEMMQSAITKKFALSLEDLPSDSAGARFATRFFDPN